MTKQFGIKSILLGLGFIGFVALLVSQSCARKPKTAMGDVAQAAMATYVAPGDLDEYYMFYSGGQSGNIFVAGVPSMRHIATIPVFTPYPSTGPHVPYEDKISDRSASKNFRAKAHTTMALGTHNK